MKHNDTSLIEVNSHNVDEHGFFCCMSKRQSVGWKAKRAWLRERFDEGLKLYMLGSGQRGFIEFMPGESCWRPVKAAGWTVIHCLWVVGKSKGHGGAGVLLEQCIADAKAAGSHGVATVASTQNFSTAPSFYEHFGFRRVERAPPKYELMALRFNDGVSMPRFTRAATNTGLPGDGIVIQTSDQCPYHAQLAEGLCGVANDAGMPSEVIPLRSAEAVRAQAATAHGVFGVAVNGEVVPNVFLPRDLKKALKNGAG